MAWLIGTDIFQTLIALSMGAVPDPGQRAALYVGLIPLWEEKGADNLTALVYIDEAFDVALGRVHPELWSCPPDDPEHLDYDGAAMFMGDPPTIEGLHLDAPMSADVFAGLKRGDLVRNVGDAHAMLIDFNHGRGRFTAVRTAEVTNHAEWILAGRGCGSSNARGERRHPNLRDGAIGPTEK